MVAYPQLEESLYSIPDGTLHIGDLAFWYNVNLTNISIPESLRSIGEGAFFMSSLSSVDLTENVVSIAKYAFGGSDTLTNVVIPGESVEIAEGAFSESPNVFLSLQKESAVELYAKENGLPYMYMDGAYPDTNDIQGDLLYFDTENGVMISGHGEVSPEGFVYLPGVLDEKRVVAVGDFAFVECSDITN